jgi:hypothetical protein
MVDDAHDAWVTATDQVSRSCRHAVPTTKSFADYEVRSSYAKAFCGAESGVVAAHTVGRRAAVGSTSPPMRESCFRDSGYQSNLQ